MNKNSSYRSSYIISRDNNSFDRTQKEPEWANDFFANLEKEAVHSKQKDVSLFDQISQIIGGGKSKYSNVEEAVLDMQKRTGLYDYLKKSAQDLQNKQNEPIIFKEMPEVKTFIDNYINDRPGSAIEAVVSAILRVDNLKKKLKDEDINDDVRKYINDKITESKKMHGDLNHVNMNLGKVDLTDAGVGTEEDFFAGCMPAGKK